MTKTYTEDDFFFQLSQDFNWRLKEISTLKTVIRISRSTDRSVLLRSMITILYAHWEGHVRFCASKYFDHIATKRLPFSRLSRQIYKNNFLTRIDAMAQSRPSVQQRCELVETILDSVDQRFARVNTALVDTGSNLNSEILRRICLVCELDFRSFEGDEDFIDRIILRRRNAIAHGEETYINLDELDDISSKTINLMRKFKDGLQNNVALRTFMSGGSVSA